MLQALVSADRLTPGVTYTFDKDENMNTNVLAVRRTDRVARQTRCLFVVVLLRRCKPTLVIN